MVVSHRHILLEYRYPSNGSQEVDSLYINWMMDTVHVVLHASKPQIDRNPSGTHVVCLLILES